MRDENDLRTTIQLEDEKKATVEGRIDYDIKFNNIDRQNRNILITHLLSISINQQFSVSQFWTLKF